MAYSVKPATSIDQQVALLKGRGLVIPDEVAATAILQRISFSTAFPDISWISSVQTTPTAQALNCRPSMRFMSSIAASGTFCWG